MRRTLPVVFALLLAVMPGATLAQSPAPSGPPAFEMAPGVVAEGLAFLPGATDPVVYRLRFEPGSTYDAVGDAAVALVTIESGSVTITAPVELTVYSATGDGTPRTATAGSAATMETGDTFLFPAARRRAPDQRRGDSRLDDRRGAVSRWVRCRREPGTHRWLLRPPPEDDSTLTAVGLRRTQTSRHRFAAAGFPR